MASCKDCLHEKMCYGIQPDDAPPCPDFADCSEYIHFLTLPSTTVYVDSRILFTFLQTDKIRACKVVNVRIGGDLMPKYYLRPYDNPLGRERYHIFVTNGAFGKTVFLTREEAEKALKERES